MKLTGIKVAKEYCPQNHPCPSLRICPVGAIKQKAYNAPTIDDDVCILCGKCAGTCPVFRTIKE